MLILISLHSYITLLVPQRLRFGTFNVLRKSTVHAHVQDSIGSISAMPNKTSDAYVKLFIQQ